MNLKIAIVALVKLEQDKLLHYNPQSLGLAKAFAPQVSQVDVYSFEQLEGTSKQVTEIAENVRLIQQDCPGVGRNTIAVTKYIGHDYDCMICFSDIQISYAGLDRWCTKHGIRLFPYVGVIKSSSENIILRSVMRFFAERNVRMYRNRLTFVKTVQVKNELAQESVSTVLTPVGLDLSYLKDDTSQSSSESIKEELGFQVADSVVLFVGRLVEEKRPLDLIDLFQRLYAHDNRYKLCIVGDGHLKTEVHEKLKSLNLADHFKHYPVVKNSEMWKFYHAAGYSVNLNLAEIFGMSILEAMYYRTLVVARRAPGPEMIITHNEDGYLCDTDDEIFETIISSEHCASTDSAYRKIVEEFSWSRTSEVMLKAIKSDAF